MQKIFLAISISIWFVTSISFGATSNIAFKIYDDYSLTNGTCVWVTENDDDRHSIKSSISFRLEHYYHVKYMFSSPDQYGQKAEYKIEYSSKSGVGRPWISPHSCCLCLPDWSFVTLYYAKLRLISLRTNKVVAEVEYRRHRLGPNIGSYVYRMVDTLVSKGAEDVSRPGKYFQYFMGE